MPKPIVYEKKSVSYILNYIFRIKLFLRHHLRWLVCPILTWVFQQRFQNQALWKILLIRSSDWLEYRAVKVWKYFSAHGSNRKMVFRWLQLRCQSSIGTYGETIILANMGKPDVQRFQRCYTRILKNRISTLWLIMLLYTIVMGDSMILRFMWLRYDGLWAYHLKYLN